MTIVSGASTVGNSSTGVNGPGSRSNSRNKNSTRYSSTKIRNSSSGAGSSTLGGHPMMGAESNKREIKQRFEITKKLGSGTYGKVSLAYDHKYDREVAVKLIKKSAIENKQDLVRIRREIRIMSALNHPNIIQIFEVFENKDKIILVMEYASGGELYDYVSKNGSLPESEARRIFRQITSAVLYCHKHKVAHRDLKLENILLDVNNNAKIADFGLSNYFSDKSLLTTFCGSPLYASPEIINGTPYRGPEVDCWSLGILLYTLVYGSMPFDGRDFNRMVRQIKRGAYYEPDTPSTASMLIRNMLRVNPERRADIDDIASHWWLNLEENMPVIQELPENQITDHTPLTERAETMVVQDLADETDVFMEFGHLSNETRKKIEEFRRRRKEAEEYNENSPIKPPKAKKTDGVDVPELTSKEKSLRHDDTKTVNEKKNDFSDPLERLKQLENRLQGGRNTSGSPSRQTPTADKSTPTSSKQGTPTTPRRLSNFPLPAQPASPDIQKKVDEIQFGKKQPTPTKDKQSFTTTTRTQINWRTETDSLNMLMNQLLEQMEKGPVSMNLVARVKAHPFYDQRPMVKELLESIIAAQPKSVQKQASKIIEQQAHDIVKKQISSNNIDKNVNENINTTNNKQIPKPGPPQIGNLPSTSNKYQVPELPAKVDLKSINYKPLLEERKWHSVEVGFETDEESSDTTDNGKPSETHKTISIKESKSEGEIDVDDEELEDEDEEEYESEIDELADVVEQVTTNAPVAKPPKIVENLSKDSPPKEVNNQTAPSTNHLSTFDRGLAKRQSKGKYQHTHVELYGRGVSTEAESPPTKRKIGGPQPTPDQSPKLFDKAKKYIMKYPDQIEDVDSEEEKNLKNKIKKNEWHKSQDPDVSDKSASAILSNSEMPKETKENKNEKQEENTEESDEESEEEEEEEEGEVIIQHKTSIIGYRTITPMGPDGVKKEAPIVPVKPQAPLVNAKPYTSPAMNGVQKYTQNKENAVKKQSNTSKNEEESKNSPTETSRDLRHEIEETTKKNVDNNSLEHQNKNQQTATHSTYSRPSYLDERKVFDYKSPHSYIDRRKSIHETTPNYDEDRHSPGYTTRYNRYDDDFDSWNSGRNRFEVYQTRAEREAQLNTGGHSYRNQSNNYWFGADRSTNPYGGYKTRYDDHYNNRRSTIEIERPVTPGADYSSQSSSTSYNTHHETNSSKEPFLSRLRPVTRRIGLVLRDSESRKQRARSQSTERRLSMKEDDYNLRLMTPEISTNTNSERNDYSYVNYHDTSSTRTSMSRDTESGLAPRGILKNKQGTELDVRASQLTENSENGSIKNGVKQMLGKLRRHLSYERRPISVVTQQYRFSSIDSSDNLKYDDLGRGRNTGDTDLLESSNKKKSFLNMARRRTTEVRLGTDGKILTPVYPEEELKRPRSPIDRIKSLFRKSKDNLANIANPASSNFHSYNPAGPTTASSRFNTTDKIFGSYPSSTQSSGRQFSRYPVSSNYTSSNRFSSYTPGSSTRHWYEDSHLY